jgi:hypothetical protein
MTGRNCDISHVVVVLPSILKNINAINLILQKQNPNVNLGKLV